MIIKNYETQWVSSDPQWFDNETQCIESDPQRFDNEAQRVDNHNEAQPVDNEAQRVEIVTQCPDDEIQPINAFSRHNAFALNFLMVGFCT